MCLSSVATQTGRLQQAAPLRPRPAQPQGRCHHPLNPEPQTLPPVHTWGAPFPQPWDRPTSMRNTSCPQASLMPAAWMVWPTTMRWAPLPASCSACCSAVQSHLAASSAPTPCQAPVGASVGRRQPRHCPSGLGRRVTGTRSALRGWPLVLLRIRVCVLTNHARVVWVHAVQLDASEERARACFREARMAVTGCRGVVSIPAVLGRLAASCVPRAAARTAETARCTKMLTALPPPEHLVFVDLLHMHHAASPTAARQPPQPLTGSACAPRQRLPARLAPWRMAPDRLSHVPWARAGHFPL